MDCHQNMELGWAVGLDKIPISCVFVCNDHTGSELRRDHSQITINSTCTFILEIL
jgi:hypothetical protein